MQIQKKKLLICIGKFFKSSYQQKNQQVQCNSQILFQTVNQVEFYKDFLPWCSRSFIDKNINKNEFEATLTIDFKIYEVSYKSLVKNYQNKNYYEVESKSLDNQVFDFLIGKWQIHHINDKTCFFNYDIEFQFKNQIYQQLSSYFLDLVGKQMVESFTSQSLKKQFLYNQQNINNNKEVQQINLHPKNQSYNLEFSNIINQDEKSTLIDKIDQLSKQNKITHQEYLLLIKLSKIKCYQQSMEQIFQFYKDNIKQKDTKLVLALKDLTSNYEQNF